MRRKFLSVVLCVCMMLTMAPFAFAAGTNTGSNTEEAGTSIPANSSSGAGGGAGNVSTSTTNAITNEADLRTALESANDGGTITISGTISINAPLVITKTVTLTGGSITASDSFTANSDKLADMSLISLKTAGKVLTLKDITLDANQKTLVVFSNAGKVVVDGATITGGKTNSYVAGVYMTSASQFEMNSGSITGNEVGDSYKTDSYTQYAADLWIGANANGALTSINGGTIGNIFVNSNAWSASNPGGFTMTDGNVTNLYVEYDAGYGASFTYQGGTIENLYISTTEGNGNHKAVTPVIGMTYTGGQTSDDALTPVAQVGTTTYGTLEAAIAAATDGQTVTLLKNATENVNISAGKSVAINLNGYTVTVPSDCGIELQGKLTVTGNGKITCANTPICVDGNSAELTVNDGTIESTNGYGIYAENGGSVVVNGGTIFSQYAALSGNNTTGSMNFTVNSGILTAAQGPAIYMPGQVSLNISGGTLNGGVSLRMGQVNISGGTINAITKNIDSPSQYYNYSGNAWLPDALYVFGGTYPNGDETHGNSLNLNITGGTFNCTNGQGSAVAIYDLGKVKQDATIKISGTAKLATNASSRSAYQVLRLADIGVTSSTGGYGVNSGKVTSSITGGLFSTTIDNTYCATGLTAISNTDEATKADYPYTVGTIKANDENKIDAVTTTGTNTVNTDTIQEASKADATTVANQVKLEDSIADKVAITETDKQRGLTALVNENKVNVDATGKLTDSTTITIIKEIFLDVSVTEFNLQNNDPSIIMDITPMYSLIATTNKDNCTDSNSVKLETKPISVTDATKISITLPTTTFANKKVYITHKNDIYIATADADGKIEFTTNGFSPFTFSLTNQDIVAEVNGNAYKTLQEAANAAKDGEEINIVKNDKLDLNFTDTKSVKVTNKTSDKITVKFNGVNKDVAKDATETFSYTRPSSGGPSSSGGSISTPTTYAVNVNAATNGAVAADKKTASKGTTVTVTASPSKGYVVDAVKVVDKDGKDVAVTEKDGKYVFTMPASAVTVTGSFKAETPAPVALPFTDVKSGNWFYDAVKYAYAQGLMTGTSATTFAPNGTMNRAMIVTVLYRLEKSPAVTGASKFTDVPAGQWYSDAVAWAAANKIVNGYDETTFGPMNAVTREQMAAILFRYEQVKGLENVTLEENLNRFPDQNKISAYAIPALQWAVGQKIINGNADGTLDPTGTATRAQVAQIFTNLLNK